MFLGKGSYGQVSVRNNTAVKKFLKLSHLIQEYTALYYLKDCNHIVHPIGVDFANLELSMELYDFSLRKYLEDTTNPNTLKIIHGILQGLIELHDRQLVHGDIKPGNILVKVNPFKIVLGDCGFVSIDKYAKVERTAAVYREMSYHHDQFHDMYSLGICFLEMLADIKIKRQPNYSELVSIIEKKVNDKHLREIIFNLIREDRENRTTARELMLLLFKEDPPRWKSRIETSVASTKNYEMIRKAMKHNSKDYKVNRAKKGYTALVTYLEKHNISEEHHKIYTFITIMILSAIFGNSGFKDQDILQSVEKNYTIGFIHKALKNMLSDEDFVNLLFTA